MWKAIANYGLPKQHSAFVALLTFLLNITCRPARNLWFLKVFSTFICQNSMVKKLAVGRGPWLQGPPTMAQPVQWLIQHWIYQNYCWFVTFHKVMWLHSWGVVVKLQIPCWIKRWKKFENWPILRKVMNEKYRSFLTHSVLWRWTGIFVCECFYHMKQLC